MTVRNLLSLLSRAHSLDDEVKFFAAYYNSETKEGIDVLIEPNWHPYEQSDIELAYSYDGSMVLTGSVTHIYRNTLEKFKGVKKEIN